MEITAKLRTESLPALRVDAVTQAIERANRIAPGFPLIKQLLMTQYHFLHVAYKNEQQQHIRSWPLFCDNKTLWNLPLNRLLHANPTDIVHLQKTPVQNLYGLKDPSG